jgi:hypothetical protein
MFDARHFLLVCYDGGGGDMTAMEGYENVQSKF